MTNLPLLLSPKNIAELYGFDDVQRVYRLIHKGAFGDPNTLPKRGRYFSVPRDAVLAWANSENQTGAQS